MAAAAGANKVIYSVVLRGGIVEGEGEDMLTEFAWRLSRDDGMVTKLSIVLVTGCLSMCARLSRWGLPRFVFVVEC